MPRSPLEITIKEDVVLREIRNLQQALGNAFHPRELDKMAQFATVNAARALQDPVRRESPDRSGFMDKQVKGRRSRLTRPGAIVGPVGGKKGAWYAKFVVYGTKAHRIYGSVGGKADFLGASINKPLKLISGQTVNAVRHPGAQSNNFVVRAAERNIDRATDAYAASMAKFMTDDHFRQKVIGLQAYYRSRYGADTRKVNG
jgi:hypothetical protein